MHIYLPFPFIFAPLLIIYHTFSVIFVCCPAEAPLFTTVQCCSVSSLKCPDSCFVGCLVPGLGWAGLGWAGGDPVVLAAGSRRPGSSQLATAHIRHQPGATTGDSSCPEVAILPDPAPNLELLMGRNLHPFILEENSSLESL